MIRFVICNASDGTILRSGFCSDANFSRQALGQGEVAVEVPPEVFPVNDETHFVDLSGEAPLLSLR